MRLPTADSLLNEGIGQYRTKQYQGAVHTFTQALSLSKDDSKLLDLRAAAYEKLGRHPDALKDAQRMIRLNEAEPNGYLRAGKNLELLRKDDVALKIYQRGLRLCSKIHTNYQLLQTLSQKVAKRLSSSDAVDFIAILPTEIIELIFSFVSFGTLCKCLNVNRSWRDFLTAWPGLWRTVDFSGARKSVRCSAMSQYIKYGKGQIRHAYLKGVELQGTNALYGLARLNPNLETLHVLTGGALRDTMLRSLDYLTNLKELVLDASVVISRDTMNAILSTCRNLEVAHFHQVSPQPRIPCHAPCLKLREFSVYFRMEGGIYGNPLPNTVPCPASLQKLTVKSDGCLLIRDFGEVDHAFANLQSLEISAKLWAEQRAKLPVNLRRLILHDDEEGGKFPQMEAGVDQSMRVSNIDVSAGFPNLEEIVLKVSNLPYAWVSRLLTSRPAEDSMIQLTYLRTLLCSSLLWSSTELSALIGEARLRKMEVMALKGAVEFSDDHVIQIAESLKHLKHLDLSETFITGSGIRKLVEGLSNLRTLTLNRCGRISVDAVEWARSRGIKVSFSQMASGKGQRSAP